MGSHNSSIKLLALFMALFFTVFLDAAPSNAGILSFLANVGKASKAVKAAQVAGTLTGAEFAASLFVRAGSSGRKIFVDLDQDGKLIARLDDKSSFRSPTVSAPEQFILKSIEEIKSVKPDQPVNIYISEATLRVTNPSIKLPENIKLHVVLDNNEIVPLRRLDGADASAATYVAEVRPNLLAKEVSSAELSKINGLFEIPFFPQEAKVITLFDELDASAVTMFRKLLGERHITSGRFFSSSLENLFKHNEKKPIFVVGHIEDGSFVVRKTDSSIANKIPINELEEMSQHYNVPLILLGCKAGSKGVTGYLNSVTDIHVIEQLKNVLNVDNFGDMVTAFAKDSPFVVQTSFIDAVHMGVDANLVPLKSASIYVGASVSQVRTTSITPMHYAELQSRLVPFMPTWVHGLFLGLYLATILTFGSAWRFLKKYWIAPEFVSGQRIRSILSRWMRVLFYIVALPVYNLFFLISVPFVIVFRVAKFTYKIVVFCMNGIKSFARWLVRVWKTT